MFKTMRYYGSLGTKYLKMSIQTGLEYPVNLLGWCLSNPIQFLLGYATIRFVVQQFGTINGWGYDELAFLYGLAVLSHGLSMLFFIQTWYLGYMIIHGELDRLVLRPANILFQFLFMDFNVIGIADIIPGIMVFAYGCIKIHFVWSIGNIVAFIVTLIGATLIRGAVFMVMGSLSFWTKSEIDFVSSTLDLFDKATMYPITMYPRVVQIIFTFVLPLGFICFYPATSMLGKQGEFTLGTITPLLTLAVGVGVFALSCLMFMRGMRRYESAGN